MNNKEAVIKEIKKARLWSPFFAYVWDKEVEPHAAEGYGYVAVCVARDHIHTLHQKANSLISGKVAWAKPQNVQVRYTMAHDCNKLADRLMRFVWNHEEINDDIWSWKKVF